MNYATNALDDLTLIQRFVDGKASLESNPNLRVESALDTTRLFTKKGVFLAAVGMALNMRSALVRQESQYWELISQILIESRLIPTGITEQGLMRYESCDIPQEFELNYTEARLLWRYWRAEMRSESPEQMQSRLLVQTPKGWQSVLGIQNSQQLLFIKTADDELMIHNGDRVVWLSPVVEQPETQIFAHKPLVERPSEVVAESLQILSKVIQMKEGKLYIQTAQGEVVVEGTDLRFRLEATNQEANSGSFEAEEVVPTESSAMI